MCNLIVDYMPGASELNWEKVEKISRFFGKNLMDFEEAKPLVELALKSDYFLRLEEYIARKIQKGFVISRENEIRRHFELKDVPYLNYWIILPRFMGIIDVYDKTEQYKLFEEIMGKLVDKQIIRRINVERTITIKKEITSCTGCPYNEYNSEMKKHKCEHENGQFPLSLVEDIEFDETDGFPKKCPLRK